MTRYERRDMLQRTGINSPYTDSGLPMITFRVKPIIPARITTNNTRIGLDFVTILNRILKLNF